MVVVSPSITRGHVTRQCDGMAHAQYRTDSNEYLSREAGVGLIHVQQAFNDRLSVSATPLPCLRLFSVVKAKIFLRNVFFVLCEKAKLFSFMRLEKIRSLRRAYCTKNTRHKIIGHKTQIYVFLTLSLTLFMFFGHKDTNLYNVPPTLSICVFS